MKNQFKGFYTPEEQDLKNAWSCKKTLFIFDTNVLLNLYSYSQSTREDFFNIVDSISGNIWIPHHVALEYQRRRLEVIRDEKTIFKNIEKELDKIENILNNEIPKIGIDKRIPNFQNQNEKLNKKIKKAISEYKSSLQGWDQTKPDVRSHDPIRSELDRVLEGKVGLPYTQKDIDEIQSEGEERYKNEIPPGYQDYKKEAKTDSEFNHAGIKYKKAFSDLIIWKQILSKAEDGDYKNIILVTDDTKEDWWYILKSRGDKVVRPRSELQTEIYNNSQINIFHMYTTSSFLRDGKHYKESIVKEDSIEETQEHFDQYKDVESSSKDIQYYSDKNVTPISSQTNLSKNPEEAIYGTLHKVKEYERLLKVTNDMKNSILGVFNKNELQKLQRKIAIDLEIIKNIQRIQNDIYSAYDEDTSSSEDN